MTDNILICGGFPRCGTTFLHTELSNYSSVFKSVVKESHLFERKDVFIDYKLRHLRRDRLYLDFTPEYIFNEFAVEKIKARRLNCFFLVREYRDFARSIKQYLKINSMGSDYLGQISEAEYAYLIEHVSATFPTIQFDALRADPAGVVDALRQRFGLELGERLGSNENLNASDKRAYYTQSMLREKFGRPFKFAKSTLFGLI